MKNVTLQDLINEQVKGGITDLEINVLPNNIVEIGYWSFAPVTLYKIKNNKLISSVFPRFKIENGYFGDAEQVERIKNNLEYVYKCIDEKTFIDVSDVDSIKGVIRIFHDFYETKDKETYLRLKQKYEGN